MDDGWIDLSETAPLPQASENHCSVVINHTTDGVSSYHAHIFVFDTSSDTITESRVSLKVARAGHRCMWSRYDDRIYVFGGYKGNNQYLDSIEYSNILNATTGTVSRHAVLILHVCCCSVMFRESNNVTHNVSICVPNTPNT